MLAYTVNRMLDQRVTFERDIAVRDRFGAESARDWQPTITVPCKWWWQKQSARGPAREEATADEVVLNAEGGMLIAGGQDVKGTDRIAQVTDRQGNVLLSGPVHITALEAHASLPPVVEITWKQPD